jgi:hypothetical protein
VIIENIINQIINPLIQLLLGAGLLVFLWGMFEFMRALNDPGAQETGKRHMVWGIIGLAIMISVFALINFVQDFVGSFA